VGVIFFYTAQKEKASPARWSSRYSFFLPFLKMESFFFFFFSPPNQLSPYVWKPRFPFKPLNYGPEKSIGTFTLFFCSNRDFAFFSPFFSSSAPFRWLFSFLFSLKKRRDRRPPPGISVPMDRTLLFPFPDLFSFFSSVQLPSPLF